MHGDNVFYSEQSDGAGGLARAHSVEIADGEESDIGLVEFADEFHVAEDGGISCVINGEAA